MNEGKEGLDFIPGDKVYRAFRGRGRRGENHKIATRLVKTPARKVTLDRDEKAWQELLELARKRESNQWGL